MELNSNSFFECPPQLYISNEGNYNISISHLKIASSNQYVSRELNGYNQYFVNIN